MQQAAGVCVDDAGQHEKCVCWQTRHSHTQCNPSSMQQLLTMRCVQLQ